ncbi:hypothetical protein [Psychroserpens sp. SPM9]|nr:hypothetical protein [Psychroserpens sp. SPM9]MDG5490883.1 hypothetical protein [Psychroserpens sp. SPM9]
MKSIQPLKLNVVEVPSEKKDIFGGRIMKTISRTLTSDQISLTVK